MVEVRRWSDENYIDYLERLALAALKGRKNSEDVKDGEDSFSVYNARDAINRQRAVRAAGVAEWGTADVEIPVLNMDD